MCALSNYQQFGFDITTKLNLNNVYNIYKQNLDTISYGGIAYKDNKGEREYLIATVRDSIPYREFLNGKLKPYEMEFYISEMTTSEIKRLRGYYDTEEYKDFEKKFLECKQLGKQFNIVYYDNKYVDRSGKQYNMQLYQLEKSYFYRLWSDLLVNKETPLFLNCKDKHKEFVKNMLYYKVCIVNVKPKKISCIFPKGRKNTLDESDMDAAKREVDEEIKLDNKSILTVDLNVQPVYEVYKGYNKNLYITKYYAMKIPYKPNTRYYYNKDIKMYREKYVSSELSIIEWLPFDEALKKLSDAKKLVLTIIHEQLNELYKPKEQIKEIDQLEELDVLDVLDVSNDQLEEKDDQSEEKDKSDEKDQLEETNQIKECKPIKIKRRMSF